MKNFKILFVLVLMIIGYGAKAQLTSDDLLVGGMASFTSQFVENADNPFTFTLIPTIYKMVNSSIAVGGELGLTYTKAGEVSSTGLSILPGARYYFTDGSGGPAFFLGANAGLALVSIGFDGESESESAFAFQIAPGVAFFVAENVSIDITLPFQRVGGDFDASQIGLNVGFQIYLRPGE